MHTPSLFDVNKNIKGNKIKTLNYIDLFCGAGGFSLGFDRAGFENLFSVDVEDNFCKTYRANFPTHQLIQKDITKLTDDEVLDLIKAQDVDVVIGGPPCQGFSIAGNIGRKFIDDPRNKLFKEFVRVVKTVKPKYFVMENVARLYTHNNSQTKKEIIEDFEELGYKVRCEVLNSADYDVPQIRKRVIFIGSKDSENILFPKITSTEYKTVENALKDLPVLNSSQESNIPNHKAMNHTQQMLEKMSFIKDGGDRTQIPQNLRPASGDARKYIKYSSNKPSITITGDMRKVFHYSQNRALTVRELARLQTFPDSFEFQSSSISQQQQVGNAVPPLMAEAIAKSIKEMIEDKNHA